MVDSANGPPKADLDVTRRFLATLDPEGRVNAPHAFHTLVDPSIQTRQQVLNLAHSAADDPRFDAPFHELEAELERLNQAGAGVFVSINDRRKHADGPTGIESLSLRACCCSWTGGQYGVHDGYTVPLRTTATKHPAGPPPSMVVRTPTGVQWWWLLHAYEGSQADAVDKWQRVQRTLAEQHGGDAGFDGVDAFMRLPGFSYQAADPLDPNLHRRVEEDVKVRIRRGDFDVEWGTPAAAQLVYREYLQRGGKLVSVDVVRLEKCDPIRRYEIERIIRGFDLAIDPPPRILSPRELSVTEPDVALAKRYLEVLDPTAERHTFQTYDDRGSDQDLTKILHGTLDQVLDALSALNQRGAAVMATVNATDFQGRGNHNIVSTRAFFCDWDDAAPPRGSGALPLTMCVSREAGGHRKYHGYWALAEPVEIAHWKLVQRALVQKLCADPGAILLNQALRIPGFCNNKGDPIQVELEECHPDRRYTVEQIIDAYELAPIIEEFSKPRPERAKRDPDDEGPWDDYVRRGDWSVLERAGWTQARLAKGDEIRWTKPGGQRKEVHATTDHDGHVGIFKCFSSKAPPFEGNKAYSRFQVLAELEFSSDYAAAARHLIDRGYGKSSEDRKREYAKAAEDAHFAASIAAVEAKEIRKVAIQGPVPPDDPFWGSLSTRPNGSALYDPEGAPATSSGGGGKDPPRQTGSSSGGYGDGDGDGDDLPIGDGNAPVLMPLSDHVTYAQGPDQIVMSHLGNCERFLDKFKTQIRYVKTFDSWYVWTGQRWQKDADVEETNARPLVRKGNEIEDYVKASKPDPFDAGDYIQEIGKDVVRRMHVLTNQIRVLEKNDDGAQIIAPDGKPKVDKGKTEEKRKQWIGHCVRSESEGAIRQLLNLARSSRELARFPSFFDGWNNLINTETGVFDLQTGRRYPHHPGLSQSKIVRVKPKRSSCPTWTKFLGRVLRDDDDLIRFVQRAVGYSLTGETREQVLFLLYGTGRNGKSTFLNVLHDLAGEYSSHAEFSTFIERQSETVRNDLARLHRSRLVTAVEPKSSGYLDEAVIKQVTGQDVVTARFLFHEHFEYVPRFKIWLAANHKPMIRGNDEGIWRRILMVPFTVTIPEEEKDPDLPAKLRAELPAIFEWAVDGATRWYEQGLRPPGAVLEATQAYRDEMDTIGMFITMMCVQNDKVRAGASALYERYRKWTEQAGERPMSQKKFGMRLEERGILKRRTNRGYEYRGIGISDESAPANDAPRPYKDD